MPAQRVAVQAAGLTGKLAVAAPRMAVNIARMAASSALDALDALYEEDDAVSEAQASAEQPQGKLDDESPPQKAVVVVGAGPVGLLTAVQVKLMRPMWRVECFERHGEYVRRHILRLSADSFRNAPDHPEIDDLKVRGTKWQLGVGQYAQDTALLWSAA